MALTDDQYEEIEAAQRVYASGDARRAAELFLECIRFFGEEDRESRSYAQVLCSAGAALAESNRSDAAKQLTRTALERFEKLDLPQDQALAHFNLGNIYKYQNLWRPMFEHFTRASELYETLGNRGGYVQSQLALAAFFANGGTLDVAERFLKNALAKYDEAKGDPVTTWSLNTIGAAVLRHKNDLAGAEGHLVRALTAAKETGNESYVHEARAHLGLLRVELGHSDADTRELLEEAYRWSKSTSDRRLLEIVGTLAHVSLKLGESPRARELFEESLDLVDLERSQLDGTHKHLFMEKYAGYGLRLVELHHDNARHESAFEIAERVQGRTLLDRMFRHQLKRHAGRSIRVLSAARIGVDAPRFDDVRAFVRREDVHVLRFVEVSKERLLASLLTPEGDLHSWDASSAVQKVRETISQLPQMTVLDAYAGDKAEALRVTEDDLNGSESDSWPTVAGSLCELYGTLLPADVRMRLESTSGRLVVVPHGDLWCIPFDAIGPDSSQPLGLRWETTVAPSLGVLLQLDPRRDSDPPPRGALEAQPLVVAAPAAREIEVSLFPGAHPETESRLRRRLDLPALLLVESEARQIGLLFGCEPLVGKHATTRAIATRLRDAPLVHFAAHAISHPIDPTLSFVVLETEELSYDRVMDKVCRAELVVLSCCETALNTPNPDSPQGLAEGFLIAGARSVVASLWPVTDDERTIQFMLDFYVSLRQGQRVSRALLDARRASVERSGVADGYCWSAFRVMGWPSSALRHNVRLVDGPIFCGGDLLFKGASFPAGTRLDLEKLSGFRGQYGQGIVVG